MTYSARKLLYVSQALVPSTSANSVHVLNMCSAFLQHRWSVTLFCRRLGRAPVSAEQLGRHYGVPLPGLTVRFAWLPPIPGGAVAYAMLCVLRAVVRRLVGGGEIVYARCLYSAWMLSKCGVPVWYETHAPARTGVHAFMERALLTSASCRGVIVVTAALRTEMLRLYGSGVGGKLHVFADGAFCASLSESITTGPAPDEGRPIVMYTGSFVPGKGVELVVSLARAMPDTQFWLVGGNQGELSRVASATPENVRLCGRVSPAEARALQRRASVLLLPNQPRVLVDAGRVDIGAWTSPIKLFEYMAAGRPIVASDLPVIREVVSDGQNALLAAPNDVCAWETQVRRLLSNQGLARQLAERATSELAEKWSWLRRAEGIERLLMQGPMR